MKPIIVDDKHYSERSLLFSLKLEHSIDNPRRDRFNGLFIGFSDHVKVVSSIF